MRLYYTGSTEPLGKQSNPLLSLGGYISSTPLENVSDGNLFPSLSQNELTTKSIQTRMLVLKNETGGTQVVNLYYENLNDSIAYYKMALVAPAIDSCNNKYFEKIDNLNSVPVSASFTDNRAGNALTFSMAADLYIGVWIQRVTLPNKGKALLTCDSLNSFFIGVNDVPSDEENVAVWSIPSLISNSYFTFGGVAIIIHDGAGNPITINGYESMVVKYMVGDSIATVDGLIQDKIDSILVPRGEVVRDGNALITKEHIPTPKSDGIDITFASGNIANNLEQMSIIIDY